MAQPARNCPGAILVERSSTPAGSTSPASGRRSRSTGSGSAFAAPTTPTCDATSTSWWPVRSNRSEIDVAIGVTHAPYRRVIDAMAADGMDLIVAGHTHGGQVCVPFYGALVTNCDLDTRRVKGLSLHSAGGKTSYLHVSAGVGTSPYAPFRFACRPEATLISLVPRDRLSAVERRSAPREVANARPQPVATGALATSRDERRTRETARPLDSPRLRCRGVWRSLVARFVRDEEVAGSNPVTPTSKTPSQQRAAASRADWDAGKIRPSGAVGGGWRGGRAGGESGCSSRWSPLPLWCL